MNTHIGLTTQRITSQATWNDFVLRAPQYSFLHSWEWGQVQQQVGEVVEYVGLFEGTRQRGAALLIGVRARRGYHWLCPHGPLVNDERLFPQACDLLKHFVRSHSFPATALRLAPLRSNTPNNQHQLANAGFRRAPMHVHAELTWVLDITPDEATLLRGMRKTTRHAIRKAEENGVRVDIISDASGVVRFLPLYEQTRQRHGFVPFSTRMLKLQLETFCPSGHAFTVVASHQGRDIAAAMLVHFGTTVYYYHGASLNNIAVPGPHAIQWQAIREAKRRGATHYNFWGIAPENVPTHPFAGITVFKKGFGGYPVDLLPAHDYPLSWKYVTLWLVDSWRKYRRGF